MVVKSKEKAPEKVEAEKVEAEKVEAEKFRTTRPIWSRNGNIIPALKTVTQNDVSTSIDELIKVGHVERYNPKKR